MQETKRTIPLTSDTGYAIGFARATLCNHTYFVPEYAAHRPAARQILNGQFYEPETHRLVEELFLQRPGSMIHAGTFFGDMLPDFASKCPATVYAFEPVLENFVLAKLCVWENDLTNVYLMNSGLSDTIENARIQVGHGDSGVHLGGASRISDQGQLTPVITIDSLGLQEIAIIQLDVEGHELQALRGALQTIRRCAPTVLIEDNENACHQFLSGQGYRHVGDIPGLHVWAASAHHEQVGMAIRRARNG